MCKLDKTDYAILEILKKDGRRSYSDIAQEVHLSRVAVRDRIIAMQESDVICGYTVQINAKAYNRNVSVFFDIEVDPGMLDAIAEKLSLLDDITIISQHTGTAGLHVHAFLENIEYLGEFMNNTLYAISGVRTIHSHVLIKNYKINVFLR